LGTIGEEQDGFFFGIGRCGRHGMMAGGMEAKDDLAARRSFQAQTLRADRHATVGADLDERADTPHIVPPRAARCRAHHRTVFFLGPVPGPLWGWAQFPAGFVGVVVRPQVFDVALGDGQPGNLFTGEAGRQAAGRKSK